MKDTEFAASLSENGFAIIRNLVPPLLLKQLRAEAEKVTKEGREKFGAQARRVQPLDGKFDAKVFKSFVDLPELQDSLRSVSSEFYIGANPENPLQDCALMINPEDHKRCTYWHRDWRDRMPIDEDLWHEVVQDDTILLSYTCALYQDENLWVVPGSHNRPDLPAEVPFRDAKYLKWSDWDASWQDGSRENSGPEAMMDYITSMPGAVHIKLKPGDFLAWRSSLWHLGYYEPSCRRASIHDMIGSSAHLAWVEDTLAYSNDKA